MRREQLTEKILDIKRHKGWSWKHITEEIGGVSPVLIVGALLGQMKLVKPLAKKTAQLSRRRSRPEAPKCISAELRIEWPRREAQRHGGSNCAEIFVACARRARVRRLGRC